MSLWSFRKKAKEPADTGRAQKRKKTVKRSLPVAMEVKVLAIEAVEAGLSAAEAGELAGVSAATIQKWQRHYAEGGVEALVACAGILACKRTGADVRSPCYI